MAQLGGEKRVGPRPQEGPRGSRLAGEAKQTEEKPVERGSWSQAGGRHGRR